MSTKEPHFSLTYGRGPRATDKTFHEGALAYLDSFAGMIPVKVTKIADPGSGASATGGRIEYVVTATRPSYPKGYRGVSSASHVVPRSFVRGGKIQIGYRWEPKRSANRGRAGRVRAGGHSTRPSVRLANTLKR